MEFINGKYVLAGGLDPLALCREFGTPLYVYDAAVMERQYRRITSAFPYPKLHNLTSAKSGWQEEEEEPLLDMQKECWTPWIQLPL